MFTKVRQIAVAVLLVVSLSATTPLVAAPSRGDDGDLGIATRVMRVVKRIAHVFHVVTLSDDIGVPHP